MIRRVARIVAAGFMTAVLSTSMAWAAQSRVPDGWGTSSADPTTADLLHFVFVPDQPYTRDATEKGHIGKHDNYPLYFQVKIAVAEQVDIGCGRISKDVSAGGADTSGSCRYSTVNTSQGAYFRLCRNINNFPDACQGYSSLNKPNS